MKSASLCWGQRYMWLRLHQLPPEHRHETHVVLRLEVPAGVTLAHCRAMLTHLTRRHEILRTTYHVQPEPVQRVDRPRALRVIEVSTERDGTVSPQEVIEEISRRPFDLATDWPIRACVITTGGVPKQCVLVLNHLAVDVWTLGEIRRELQTQAAGFVARRPAALPPVRRQPSDLARHEDSADAAVVAARALAYWREEVARLPRDPFARRRGPVGEPAARHATLISPALLDVTRRVAGRHRVWPSLVHVTAYTAMMALYTGQDSVGCLSFVSNRESHPFPDVMTCMFSPMLVRVDCTGDPTFGELLRRVSDAFARAREHSYVPYDKVVEMVSREGSARGGQVRLGSEINFIKQRSKDYHGRRTTFTWHAAPDSWARCGLDTYLRVDEWRDAVAVALHAMSSVMDATTVERFVRGMEALALAHDDPGADLRLGEAARLASFAPSRPEEPAGDDLPGEARDDAGGEAVETLIAAVRYVHGLARVDSSDSYTLAGGHALRIPQVLADLGRRGWEGLSLQELAGPTPLNALAARLAPRLRTPSTPTPSNSE